MSSNPYSCPRCGRGLPNDGDPLDRGCRGCGYDPADEEEEVEEETERAALFAEVADCLKEAKACLTRSVHEANWIEALVDTAFDLLAWSCRCERKDLVPSVTRMLDPPPPVEI